MIINQTQYDERNNLVVATLFESYLAKFILEHPRFYQSIYCKTFDDIEVYLKSDPNHNLYLKRFLQSKAKGYDFDRDKFRLFSQLSVLFPEQTSFTTLRNHFNLRSANYFIKLILDYFLPKNDIDVNCFFTPTPVSPNLTRRSPNNPFRTPSLFAIENRGVNEIEDVAEEKSTTRSLGIVSSAYTPDDLKDYFEHDTELTRNFYEPNESSFVATMHS